MTTVEFTTPLQVAAAIVTQPDWKANHAAAQAAGDLAYEDAQASSETFESCYDAYHATYIETMRALGTPAVCHCADCAGERGDISR